LEIRDSTKKDIAKTISDFTSEIKPMIKQESDFPRIDALANSKIEGLSNNVDSNFKKVRFYSSDPLPFDVCPQCGSPNLERSSATDYKHDETYFSIKCKKCGWSDWTQ
jgi:hypothetical protein